MKIILDDEVHVTGNDYSGHLGHIEGIFRDLFSCTILTKTFRKTGYICPKCPEKKTMKSFEDSLGDTVPGTPGTLMVFSGIFFLYNSHEDFPEIRV